MIVIGNDLVRFEGRLDVFGNFFVRGVFINLGLYFLDLLEDFLVSEIVEGIGEIV